MPFNPETGLPLGRPASDPGRSCRAGSAAAARCAWPLRAVIAAVLALLVVHLIPGQPAAPAAVLALIAWFVLTGRHDLAPPPDQ